MQSFKIFTGGVIIWGFLSGSIYMLLNGIAHELQYIPIVIAFILSIPVHELIHGITVYCVSDNTWKTITYGVDWKHLRAYCQFTDFHGVPRIISTLMPGFVLGFIPMMVALCIGNINLLCFSILSLAGAGSDIISSFNEVKELDAYSKPFKNISLGPFMACVWFLRLLGKCTGLSYKQISVAFNLWIQGAVLSASASLPFLTMAYQCICHGSVNGTSLIALAILLGYAATFWYGYVLMLQHYKLPMEQAFDLCVDDLMQVAKWWHSNYYAVNLIIFVLAYISMLGTNLLLFYLLLSTSIGM